jgi:hypothetical protein
MATTPHPHTQDNVFWLTTHSYNSDNKLALSNLQSNRRGGRTLSLRTASRSTANTTKYNQLRGCPDQRTTTQAPRRLAGEWQGPAEHGRSRLESVDDDVHCASETPARVGASTSNSSSSNLTGEIHRGTTV